VLVSTANQEGITYDDNDDDVHNIGMMDIQKVVTNIYEMVPVS
jgi:hypothetical protein